MEVSNTSGLRKPKYTQFNDVAISLTKGKIRTQVDALSTNDGQPYDLHDQLADLSNAVDAIIPLLTSLGADTTHPAITKFLTRKSAIDTIVINNI